MSAPQASAVLRRSDRLRILAALVLCSCSAAQQPRGVSKAKAEPARHVQSNVTRADYAGSASCEPCHGAIYQAWQASPMHRMTRPAQSDIRAHFDGTEFRLGHDVARVEQRGSERFLQIDGSGAPRRYRVTKVIGGRHREDFVGVEVSGAAGEALEEDAESPSAGGEAARGREQVLPLSWVYGTSSWRYKGYSVMLPERPALRAGPVWAATCIGCHNTLPYLTLAYDDLLGPSAPAYQGSVHDRLLPARRLWQARVKDEAGLKQVVATEIEQLGGPPRATAEGASLERVLGAAISTTRHELGAQHLVELGVGCESCHYGAREHLADTGVRPSFGVESSLFEIAPSAGAPTRAEQINRTCAHCHSVLLSSYPWTWEGKRRRDPLPGGSSTNSGEGRDFLLGGCSQELACSSCHDPHAEDSAQRLARLATPSGNALCVGCHQQYAAQPALTGHTHHAAGSAGSACVECHMPRKNMGLDYRLTRYHRIGSPTDAERVLGDRPLECALCHADRSVESLTADMERWWHESYPREALRALYGADLNANTLQRTLERGKPHEQAVAMASFGDQRVQSALPQLLPQLTHEYPLLRFYAKAAIERITGQPLPVDVNGSVAEIRAASNRWWLSRKEVSAP
ncbi:MAG TPA: cytochrome c3 family protein [Polyangiales bacterium]|nr:cytochrome c3 family protein [Polyangiales bacterium]